MGMAKQSSPGPVPVLQIPVLLTRPEPDATAFAHHLTGRFGDRVRPVVAPLMAVEHLKPRLPDGAFDAVIFTSAAGVAAAEELQSQLPKKAWCVGEKTAWQAQAAGWDAVTTGGDADALVAAIEATRPEGRLLHLRGEDTRGAVAERLTSAGIETESLVVYRQAPQPLTAEALELLRGSGVVIVPLFSPRSAALFRDALPQDQVAPLRLVCISPAVAEVVADIGGSVTVADRPNGPAMLAAIARVLA